MPTNPRPDAVLLPRDVWDSLAAAAHEAAPREFVAVLFGARRGGALQVAHAAPLPNAAAGDDRFDVDAAAFVAREHEGHVAGHDWIGFVHSHPRGPATLSAADRASLWRGCAQLLLAPDARGRLTVSAFWLEGADVHGLRVLVGEGPAHEAAP
jgi:desampylase